MSEVPGPDSSLQDWLTWQENLHVQAIELGLERVLEVYRRLFRRRPAARIIIVGGTNGKGSTVAALERLLMRAGRTTGAYTSPHLHRYNERVRLNGEAVDDVAWVRAFVAVEEARRGVSLTYFEFGTLAALWLMAEAGVQDWVLEVGLGGRLDAVNIVDPTLAIITSVDLDHVDWLGTDRDQIGFEKAGIFRPDIPALYGESDPPKSVLQQAQAQRVRLWCQGIDYGHCSQGNILRRLDGENVELPVLPDAALPVTSLYTAAQAMVLLGFAPADVVAWLPAVAAQGLEGRYEKIASTPEVRVDVGHNPHAARWLAQRVASARAMLGTDARVYVVYAALADKDVEGVMAAMAPVVDQWLLAGLDVPRGLSVDALAARAASLKQMTLHPTVEDALDVAFASARPTDLVVVFGSFHTVAQAREHLAVGKRPVASAHSDDVFSGEGL